MVFVALVPAIFPKIIPPVIVAEVPDGAVSVWLAAMLKTTGPETPLRFKLNAASLMVAKSPGIK
jgi:hypothetical protein